MTATLPERTLAGALHSHCSCMGCRIAYADWQRERRHSIANGTWEPYVDAEEARQHIEHLHNAGYSYNLIARLAKLRVDEIQRIRTDVGKRPRTTRIRPDTARAILAVQIHYSRLPHKSLVPARGAQRRIQALRAIGWPSYILGARCGLGSETPFKIFDHSTVQVSTHLRIAALYEELHDQNPTEHGITPWIARRGMRYASNNRWAVPGAWADIDTDDHPDPLVRAPHYAKPELGHRSRNVIEDTAELAALGLTRTAIAERIGIAWNSIEQTHNRADIALPVQLRQENASEAQPPDPSADP